MTACVALSDRMPDVALGRSHWSEDEEHHLADCADCRAEWAIVSAASRLRPPAPVASAQEIARRAIERASAERSRSRARARLGLAAGLAAAATVAIAVWTGYGGPASVGGGRELPATRPPVAAAPPAPSPGGAPGPQGGAPPPATSGLELALPELDSLPEEALDSILRVLDEPLARSGGDEGQMGDDGDAELERVLAGLEG